MKRVIKWTLIRILLSCVFFSIGVTAWRVIEPSSAHWFEAVLITLLGSSIAIMMMWYFGPGKFSRVAEWHMAIWILVAMNIAFFGLLKPVAKGEIFSVDPAFKAWRADTGSELKPDARLRKGTTVYMIPRSASFAFPLATVGTATNQSVHVTIVLRDVAMTLDEAKAAFGPTPSMDTLNQELKGAAISGSDAALLAVLEHSPYRLSEVAVTKRF